MSYPKLARPTGVGATKLEPGAQRAFDKLLAKLGRERLAAMLHVGEATVLRLEGGGQASAGSVRRVTDAIASMAYGETGR